LTATTATTGEERVDHIRPEVTGAQPALAEPQADIRNQPHQDPDGFFEVTLSQENFLDPTGERCQRPRHLHTTDSDHCTLLSSK
jgi:hypothetical protein